MRAERKPIRAIGACTVALVTAFWLLVTSSAAAPPATATPTTTLTATAAPTAAAAPADAAAPTAAAAPTDAAAPTSTAAPEDAPNAGEAAEAIAPGLTCGFVGVDHGVQAMKLGVARGEIADPSGRSLPVIAPKVRFAESVDGNCLTTEHIFLYEDAHGLLLTIFTPAQIYDLMVDAANRLLSVHGDQFDFIGFWTNFDPALLFGTAFYLSVRNDVTGIGKAGLVIGENETFDLHESYGLAGERIQGMINMWNVNSAYWQPGTTEAAAMTRLTLAHEFEHRFGIFLPELSDGRRLQGDNLGCGYKYHWNARIDGQGAAIDLPEWVGEINPVRLEGDVFNADTKGVYGYTDLYLMGYVSPEEMDEGNSQLRYMHDDCESPYTGPVSDFSSADIIEVAGERVPDSLAAQKHFRTAWIMIHQPGALPTDQELDKTVAILRQQMLDWKAGTLDRGSMRSTLFPDCNCNGVSDETELMTGQAADLDLDGIPDDCGTGPGCVADLNADHIVDTHDLLFVLFHWGECARCPGDLNRDGVIGIPDLLLVFTSWGPCAEEDGARGR